ncbi:HD domain-containing phosphohydrolase [Methylophaga sp. OBS3]|uniref:HD domain-containing phosphohydrolase n=1 Tax=Methylophaga sp. OBS3 TaxID=2991934 RepID=UPI0022585215|nr:HD domain-containing phosphohydrolase [Methylophaga sp. OBS3]MCX4190540.1 transporter substrate-binding domain-containing protein [Methylophaga sp. OBS3]
MAIPVKGRGFRISIRATVIAGFLISSLLIASVAIGLQYFFSKTLATESTAAVYQQTATSTRDYIAAVDSRASATTRIVAQFPNLVSGKKVPDATRVLFSEIMQRNTMFYAMYIGHRDGDFYELVNLEANENLRQQLRAKENDRWVTISIYGSGADRMRRFDYYDADFNLRNSRQHPTDYNASNRPWFTNAKEHEVFKTEPYLFQHIQAPGQTYSTVIPGTNSVLAVDIALASLSDFFKTQDLGDESEIYLYQKSGEIIASNQNVVDRNGLPAAEPLTLSDAQQAIVERNKYLLVSNETNWPPVNFAVAGQPYGYAIDTLEYIAEMTGLELRFLNGLTWREMAAMFVSGELDVIQPVYDNPYRRALGEMTEPFLDLSYGLVTQQNIQASSLNDLTGKTVAIPEGWSLIENVRENFPEITVIEVPSVREAMLAVRNGHADAAMDSTAILQYTAEQYFFGDLVVHTDIDLSSVNLPTALHFLINKDKPGLAEVFNLALENLGDTQRQALAEKWLAADGSGLNAGAVPYAELLDEANLQTHTTLQTMTLNGEEHFVYIQPMTDSADETEFFTIITPVANVLAPALEKVQQSIWVTASILLLLLPVSWLFASPIVHAVRNLALDSERIKQRRFSEVEQVRSSIVEVSDLATSMMAMSHSIEEHEKSQESLMEAFIELIAQAIDDKSPYTAGHCARVPELAFMLAEKAEQNHDGPFNSFRFRDETEWREFRIGAWLHDCGKITTPEHIVDKGTKLETIYNRIHEVRMRFEVLWRDAEITYLERCAEMPEKQQEFLAERDAKQQQLQADFAFVAQSNVGTESMSDEAIERLKSLASITWIRHFDDRLGLSPLEEDSFDTPAASLPATEQLLIDRPEHLIAHEHSIEFDPALGITMQVPEYRYNLGELHNLTVRAGTLTPEDRFKINEHIISTIKMLENLPFPPELSRVPRYASTHHETMIGTGYPRGLTKDDLSIPERIMVLADVFEALTAADRPYKKAKPVSVAVDILYKMVQREHVDRDVFELFLRSGVYLQYAKRFLPPEQIDDVDISQYLS